MSDTKAKVDVASALAAAIGESRPKKEKGEGLHYVVFKDSEWLELEAAYGRELEPKMPKSLLTNIFQGKIAVVPVPPPEEKAKVETK